MNWIEEVREAGSEVVDMREIELGAMHEYPLVDWAQALSRLKKALAAIPAEDPMIELLEWLCERIEIHPATSEYGRGAVAECKWIVKHINEMGYKLKDE